MSAQRRHDTSLSETVQTAASIWTQYVLGNKDAARMAFKAVPADKRGLVAHRITVMSFNDEGGFRDTLTFFESVTN